MEQRNKNSDSTGALIMDMPLCPLMRMPVCGSQVAAVETGKLGTQGSSKESILPPPLSCLEV